jgi:class 3 adenylate cyclase
VGINAGEPIQEGDELHGAAVMAAQAIAARAGGGEVLVANVVRELAAGKGFAFADRGEATLRGLDEPVRVWELLWAHTAT